MASFLCLKRKIKGKRKIISGLSCATVCSFLLFLYLSEFQTPTNFTSEKYDITGNSEVKIFKSEEEELSERQISFLVPNIVHYIWTGDYEPMLFHHFLSVKSVFDYMKPDVIYFHCENEPTGKWWKETKSKMKTLKIQKLELPTEIFRKSIVMSGHKSDIARIEILIKHGGIYIDTDVFVIKSFKPLRKYNFTMGIEYHGNPGRLNNGVIVAAKGAPFLHKWYDSYKNFTKREQDFHASIIPYYLQYHYPDLIHIEEKSINYPSGKQLDLIYDKVYEWSDNYCIRVWSSLYNFEHTPNDIKKMDSTFGQVARRIYYGKPDIIV